MLVIISLCFSAMVLCCLAMTKHREQVLPWEVSTLSVSLFRPIAWLLLSFTAYTSIKIFGWSIGVAVLFAALMIATLLLILLLTYRAIIIPHIAIILSIIVSIDIINN